MKNMSLAITCSIFNLLYIINVRSNQLFATQYHRYATSGIKFAYKNGSVIKHPIKLQL